MPAYYNEIDPYCARWLRNLIDAGQIAAGDVDERSIVDVRPVDLDGYEQCHFFAGIGGWSYALRLAGWPDSRSLWTGSCPCQPFSTAGKRQAFDDARHLWPEWFRLIRECRPAIVFGEQVASTDGYYWLDLVSTDLEGTGCLLLGSRPGSWGFRRKSHHSASLFRAQQSRRTEMNLSELVLAIGDDNIGIQNLDHCVTSLSQTKKCTKITFGSQQSFSIDGTDKLGLILWLDRQQVADALAADRAAKPEGR